MALEAVEKIRNEAWGRGVADWKTLPKYKRAINEYEAFMDGPVEKLLRCGIQIGGNLHMGQSEDACEPVAGSGQDSSTAL